VVVLITSDEIQLCERVKVVKTTLPWLFVDDNVTRELEVRMMVGDWVVEMVLEVVGAGMDEVVDSVVETVVLVGVDS